MRRVSPLRMVLGLALCWPCAVAGQVDLERGIFHRHGSPAAARATTVKSTSSVEKAAKGAPDAPGAGQNAPAPQPAPPAPPAPVMYVTMYTAESKVPNLSYEDPKGIRVGMASDELIRRFGPPGMEVSGSAKRTVTYFGREGIFQLDLQNEKVVSIAPTRPRPATVALPGA